MAAIPTRGDQDPRIVDLLAEMRLEAERGDMPIDTEVYRACGADPQEPVMVGSGSLDARVGVMGRDPGRTEIEQREPFIGKGGAVVRDAMQRALHGTASPTDAARHGVGQHFFWCNTVPYKPKENKAWSVKVKRRFVPLVRTLLAERWQGTELITFGNVAFDWIRLAFPHERDAVRAFWARDDRYTAAFPLDVGSRTITVRPLPHPSPLNATWYKKLPKMIDARLMEAGVTRL